METNKLSMTYVVGDESEMSLRKTNTKKHSFSEKDAHEMTRCDTIFQEIFHESSYEPKTSTFNDDDDSMNSTNIMSKELELSGSVDLDLTNNTNSTVDEFPTEILNRNKNSSRIDRESLISLKQKTNDIDAVFEANMTLVTGDYSSHDETSLTNKSIDYTHTQPKKKKYMENENITLKNPIHKKEMISRRLSSSYSDEYKSFDETISTTIYNSQKNFNKNSVIEELQIPEISHIEKSMKNHTICEQTLNLSSFSVEKVKKKETESNLMCTNITSPKKNKSEIDRQLDGKEKRKSISRNSPSILSEMEMTETNNEWENQINSMDVNMKIEDDDGNLFHHQENSFSNQILDISNKQTTKVSPINSIHSDKSFPTKFSTSIQKETNFTRSSNNLIEKSIGEIPSEISDNVSKEKSISIKRTLSFKSKNCSIRENEIIKSSNSEKYSENLSKKSPMTNIENRTIFTLNEEDINSGNHLENLDNFCLLSRTKKLPSTISNDKSIDVLSMDRSTTEFQLQNKSISIQNEHDSSHNFIISEDEKCFDNEPTEKEKFSQKCEQSINGIPEDNSTHSKLEREAVTEDESLFVTSTRISSGRLKKNKNCEISDISSKTISPTKNFNEKFNSKLFSEISVEEKIIEETETNPSLKTTTSNSNLAINNSNVNHKEFYISSHQQQQLSPKISILMAKDNFPVELSNLSLMENSKKFDKVQKRSKKKHKKKTIPSRNCDFSMTLRPRKHNNFDKTNIRSSTSLSEKKLTNVKDVDLQLDGKEKRKSISRNSPALQEELQIPEISHIEKSMKNHTICEQTLNLSSFSVEKVKKKETESNLMCTNITSPKKNKSEIDRQLDGKEKRKSISRNSPSILSEMEMTETNNEWENQINSMDVNMKIEDDDGNFLHHQENSLSNQILNISNKQTTKVSPINSIHSDKSFPTKFSTSIQNETNFTRSSNNLIEKSIGEIPSEISDNVSKEKSISIRRTLSFKSKNCSIRENEIIKSSNSEKYLKNSTKVLSKNLSKKSSIATIEKRTVSSLNEEEMNVGDSLEMSDKFSALSETKKLPSPILNGKSESERLTQISVLEKEIEETESNLSSKTMTSIPNSLIENSAINHKDEELNVPSQQQQQQQQTMSILKTKDNFSVELSNSSLVETSKKFDEVQNKSKNRQQKKKASPNIQVLRKLRPRNNSNLEKKQIHLSTSIKEKEVNETNVKDVGRLKIVGMLEKENDEPEEKTIWTKQKLNIFSSKIADISETIRRNRSHQNRLDENRLEKNKSDEEEISLGEETNMFFKEPKCPKDIVSGISSGGSKRYLLLKPEQSLKEMDEILNYDYSFDRTYQYDISFDEYSSEVMDKFLEKKFSFCSLNNFKNHLILLNVINRELAKAIGVKYQAVRGGYCENRNEKDSTWNINIIVLPPKCRTKVYRIKSSFLLIEPLNTQMKVEVLLSTDIERRCVIEIDRFESLYLSSKYSVIFQNENELENLNVHLLFGLHVERLLPRGINFKLKFPYDTIVKDWKNGRNVDIIYDCHFTDDRLVNNILLSKWPRNRVHHIDQEKSCPFYLPITPSQIIYFNFVINYLKEKFFSHIIEDVNDMRISLCQQNGINYRRLEITTEITNDQKHIEFPIFKSNLYDSTFIVYQGRLGMKLYRGNYPVKTFQLSDYDLKFMWIPAEQDISLQIEKVRVSRCNRAYFQMEIRQMLNRAALKKLVSDGRQSMSYIDFFQ